MIKCHVFICLITFTQYLRENKLKLIKYISLVKIIIYIFITIYVILNYLLYYYNIIYLLIVIK